MQLVAAGVFTRLRGRRLNRRDASDGPQPTVDRAHTTAHLVRNLLVRETLERELSGLPLDIVQAGQQLTAFVGHLSSELRRWLAPDDFINGNDRILTAR
jgi:hypothetical protein